MEYLNENDKVVDVFQKYINMYVETSFYSDSDRINMSNLRDFISYIMIGMILDFNACVEFHCVDSSYSTCKFVYRFYENADSYDIKTIELFSVEIGKKEDGKKYVKKIIVNEVIKDFTFADFRSKHVSDIIETIKKESFEVKDYKDFRKIKKAYSFLVRLGGNI